jgi:hypothetical protein
MDRCSFNHIGLFLKDAAILVYSQEGIKKLSYAQLGLKRPTLLTREGMFL